MALMWAALLATASVVASAREPVHIIGGQVADDCQWPSTVLMQGCSGTLVHPEIILYAGHCPGAGSAGFGVTGNDRSVGIDDCQTAPEYGQLGFDYKYCRLSEPVTDVPIVPVLMGCEVQQLTVDRPVVLVGFGNTANGGGGFGTKRWIDGSIAGFPSEGRIVGVFYEDVKTGICNGDSGGSGFVQLDDGSWRLFGIASTVPGSCGGSSQHIPAWHAVAFVEETSGIDITPCHDADGAWNPSPDCTAFPLDPNDGSGLTWGQGCGPGMTGPASTVCGPEAGQPQDTTAPTIAFVDPAPGIHEGPTFQTPIEIEASDDWGILDVTIQFAEEEPVLFEAGPYRLGSVVFPEGAWEITAVARDWSGNVAEASVMIEVGDVAATSGDESETTTAPSTSGPSSSGPLEDTGDPADESSEDSGSDGDPGAGSEGGCGCGAGEPAPLGLAVLALVAIARRRRSAA